MNYALNTNHKLDIHNTRVHGTRFLSPQTEASSDYTQENEEGAGCRRQRQRATQNEAADGTESQTVVASCIIPRQQKAGATFEIQGG